MEPESDNSSSSVSGSSRGSGGSRQHSGGKRRHRRHRRHRRERPTLLSRIKKGLLRFFQNNKSWLLGLLGMLVLIGILLMVFSAVERQAINNAHGVNY